MGNYLYKKMIKKYPHMATDIKEINHRIMHIFKDSLVHDFSVMEKVLDNIADDKFNYSKEEVLSKLKKHVNNLLNDNLYVGTNFNAIYEEIKSSYKEIIRTLDKTSSKLFEFDLYINKLSFFEKAMIYMLEEMIEKKNDGEIVLYLAVIKEFEILTSLAITSIIRLNIIANLKDEKFRKRYIDLTAKALDVLEVEDKILKLFANKSSDDEILEAVDFLKQVLLCNKIKLELESVDNENNFMKITNIKKEIYDILRKNNNTQSEYKNIFLLNKIFSIYEFMDKEKYDIDNEIYSFNNKIGLRSEKLYTENNQGYVKKTYLLNCDINTICIEDSLIDLNNFIRKIKLKREGDLFDINFVSFSEKEDADNELYIKNQVYLELIIKEENREINLKDIDEIYYKKILLFSTALIESNASQAWKEDFEETFLNYLNEISKIIRGQNLKKLLENKKENSVKTKI